MAWASTEQRMDRVLRSRPQDVIELLEARRRSGRDQMLTDIRLELGDPEGDKQGNRRYWTRKHVGECPACGKDVSYKERVYDKPPPEDPYDRLVHLKDAETYCGCLEGQ